MTVKTASARVKSWQAVVTEVYDGDTFNATIILGLASHGQDIDYGFHIYKEHPIEPYASAYLVTHSAIRLLGCNARELHDPGGPEARAALLALLPVGGICWLETASPDKYGGRYDAVVYTGSGIDVTSRMVARGYAAAWSGRGEKPVAPWPIKGTP